MEKMRTITVPRVRLKRMLPVIQKEEGVDVDFVEVAPILMEDDGLQFQLPKHHCFACHLLNLFTTVDAAKANSNDSYKRLSRSAFSKCSGLWNKTLKSCFRHDRGNLQNTTDLAKRHTMELISLCWKNHENNQRWRRRGPENCMHCAEVDNVSVFFFFSFEIYLSFQYVIM